MHPALTPLAYDTGMRTWLLILFVAGGCKGDSKPPAATVVAPKDAAAIRVVADAAPPADAEVDEYAWLDSEAIGPLKLDMLDADVIKSLGKPKQQSAVVEEGATGEFITEWAFPGISLEMGGETSSGPFKVRSITVQKPSKFATNKGIKIGSTLAELEKAYARSTENNDDPDQYLVGSVYGGMLFGLANGKVSSIFLGAMAF
jgi:hypothetical protein